MSIAARLLLSEEMQEVWLEGLDETELNPEFIESEEWRRLVNHPRLKIYETGRRDVDYGKLHAKYIVIDDAGFVGTTNLDDRSRLRNNEMGFFFDNPELSEEATTGLY